jgi:lipid II:glycine glycyltransferase (peptidoglycan interpeptide bridge formation enzyme)
LKIKEVKISDLAYIKLVDEIGGIFNSLKWLAIYNEKLKVFGIYDKSNRLIGVFNLYFEKVIGLTHIKNPPYTPTCSLIFYNPTKNSAKKNAFEKTIIGLIEEYISSLNNSICTITFPTENIDMQPFIWNNYKVIPNYTYRFDLNDFNSENINNNFSPERRNDIKKAIKDGVHCKLTYDYEVVKEMVQHTFDRKNKAIQEKLIDNILFKFADKTNSFAFISYLNETPIAASFVIYDNHTAYYLLGGYDPNNKHQGAGAMAVKNTVLHSMDLNLSVFDFEGSMLPEVEKYFRAFGGEMKTMFTVNKAKLPIELILKLFKRNIF